MIALVFSWVIIMAVFFTFGEAFVQLWNVLTKGKSNSSALDTILVGMCVVASTIAILSLWVPANTMLLFVLVFICILYWLINNKSIPKTANSILDFVGDIPKLHLPIYIILIISIAMFSTLHPMMTDTLYYHYQNLMWNEEYAIVPGLANLQPRFAFNSSFFLLGSTFGLKPLFGQFIFGVHTFFLAAFYVWTVYKVLNSKKIVESAFSLLMLTCLFVIYKIHITSVTTDFIPNLVITYLVIKVLFDRKAILKNQVLYFMLPIFIITLKLSCFSIALIPLYLLWTNVKEKQYKTLGIFVLAALLIVVPWCTRNVILSGYLIFPFPYIDIFSFDWKIPIEYAIEQKEFIQAFARYPNQLDIQHTLSLPLSEWLPIWWESDMFYYNSIANRAFFWLTILTIPIGAVYSYKLRVTKDYTPIILIWVASVVGIIVWFINAPDFRFIYSLILAQFFIALLFCLRKLETKKNTLQVALVIITTTFVAFHTGRWVYHQKSEHTAISKLIKVPDSIRDLKQMKGMEPNGTLTLVEVNGIKLYRMSPSDRDVMCLDSELPCSADYVGGLEMRGKTIQEGYRCKPNAPKRLTY